MQANTFDIVERRKRITIFKLGKLWVFKQFFDNKVVFNALLDYYDNTVTSLASRLRGHRKVGQLMRTPPGWFGLLAFWEAPRPPSIINFQISLSRNSFLLLVNRIRSYVDAMNDHNKLVD